MHGTQHSIPQLHPLQSTLTAEESSGALQKPVPMGKSHPEAPLHRYGEGSVQPGLQQHLPAGACSSLGRISHRTCSHPKPGFHCGNTFASCQGKVALVKLLLGCAASASPMVIPSARTEVAASVMSHKQLPGLAEGRSRLSPSFVDHVGWNWPEDLFHHDEMLPVLMGLQRETAMGC